MITALDGKRQIRQNTIDLNRMEVDFLKGQDWDVNSGSADPGTFTGIPDPVNSLDVVNKQYVDNIVAGGSGIGISSAEDGSYADGLFADFAPTTPVGTAVDRFNEVLKALAPAPAPVLAAAVSTTGSVSGKLSFDPTHVVAGVTNHPSQLINSTYTVSGNTRGIINASTNVTGTLATNVVPSYVNSRPYPNLSFGDADQGTLEIEVNGVLKHSVTLSSFGAGASVNANGTGFTLTAATSVKFDNGNALDLFKYRTGTFVVNSSDMQAGYNKVEVIHRIGATVRRTNATDWIVDNNATATTYGTTVLGAATMTGSKYLSGVRYHTAGSAAYSTVINNAYGVTYSSSASAISFNGTNCSAASQALPNTNSSTDVVNVSATAAITATRLLNAGIAITTSTLRTVQATITSGSSAASNLLLDAVADDSTAVNETFNGEGFRIHSGVVITNVVYGAAAGSSNYTWDSAQSLMGANANHNTGLLVSGGELTYPTNTTHIGTISNGDFSVANNGYAGNVNYTLAAGNRTYLRYFYTAAAKSNFRLNVTATGTTFVPLTTGASGNNVTLEILAPNTTKNQTNNVAWKDASVAHSGNDKDVGCYAATFGNSKPTNWGLTLGTKNTSTSGGVVVVRVTAGPGWTGKISNIALTWL